MKSSITNPFLTMHDLSSTSHAGNHGNHKSSDHQTPIESVEILANPTTYQSRGGRNGNSKAHHKLHIHTQVKHKTCEACVTRPHAQTMTQCM